jgi:hypothetical protein
MNLLQRWRKKKPHHPPRSPLPAPQAEPEVLAAEAALPEASMVEGEYSAEYSAEAVVPRRVVVDVE